MRMLLVSQPSLISGLSWNCLPLRTSGNLSNQGSHKLTIKDMVLDHSLRVLDVNLIYSQEQR